MSTAERKNERTEEYPGAEAEKPQQVPARGWLQIVRRAWKEANVDQVPLLAAGVAFFAFLSLFPALIAVIMVYGLIADPGQVAEQVRSMANILPQEAASLLNGQLQSLTQTPSTALGFGLVISLLAALWSASGGTGHLISAVNTAYDEEESRGWVRRKLLALGLTVGAIVFVLVALGLVAVAPVLLDSVSSGPLRWLLTIAQWVALVIVVSIALAVVYRLAPSRDAPKLAWVSVGAVVATVVWLLVSLGFSIYVDNFGKYAKTYGALAGVVIFMLWLWLTAYAVLLGAEINAESEQQTAADTTKGQPQPIGERGAVKADSVPGEEAGDAKKGRQGKP